MKYIYYLLAIFIFTACNSNRKSSEVSERINIDNILVTYYCGMIDSNVAVRCEKLAEIQAEHPINDYFLRSLGMNLLIDTFIVDKSVLREIESLLEERKEPVEAYNEDARMYISIEYSNGVTDNICLGMNTPQVLFNGEPTLIENELIYLLRLNSGYYEWFSDEELKFFREYRNF
jgi:hypothetical protein